MAGTCHRLLAFTAIIALASLHTVKSQASNNKIPKWDEKSLQPLADGISEDTKKGTLLTRLKCTDEDGDTIEYLNIGAKAVMVTAEGDVFLKVELDFEKKDSIGYDLTFGCVDLDDFGLRKHTTTRTVQLTVNDANDHAPEFNIKSADGYTYAIPEDVKIGYVPLPVINIVDGDRARNAEISKLYVICDSDLPQEKNGLPDTSIAFCEQFQLNYKLKDEGEYESNISVKASLDYEKRRVYSTKIIAVDNAIDETKRLSTTTNVQILVSDVQDMDPQFVNQGASTAVSEGAQKGDLVNLVVLARDGDVGDKRPVTIVIEKDEHQAFTLDPAVEVSTDSGVYSAQLRINNALDRESIVGAYNFVVKVIELDKVTGELTSATATATYSVQVLDIDDQPPLFEYPEYKVNVTEVEDTLEGIQITGLRMVCTDSDEARNARYTVRIVSQSFPGVFRISPGANFTSTAILFLTVDKMKFLDYDTPTYRYQTVVVEAMSAGWPKLSSSTTVSITLVDINDNRPEFVLPSYDLRISENITSGQMPYEITYIKAEDGDSGLNGEITYRLEGGTGNKFEINSKTGKLTLVKELDYELTSLYVFLVYAEDKAQNPQTSQVQVVVEVLNTNDMAPVFQQPVYQTSVNEDELRFLAPLVVYAIDKEEGSKEITYKIVEGQTHHNAFNLNSNSGELTLDKRLDYGENGLYKLTIEATDNGSPPQTARVPVRVSVIDKNNFSPVISPKLYRKTLSELVKPGTIVTTIKGTDNDSGEFGNITYRIVSGGFDNFLIDQFSGKVTVNNPQNFDYDLEKSYSIKIKASDGGAPQLSDDATLQVNITDANNKDPEFLKKIYIGTVDEKQNIGFTILTVSATDLDSSRKLSYSLVESKFNVRNGAGNLLTRNSQYDYRNALGIRSDTGEIFIQNKLDKELALEFIFSVKVVDTNAETAGQEDETRVAITVTGDVRTELSFDRIDQSFVNEGSEVGYEITTVNARDPTQAKISNYQQIGSSEFFEVVLKTGQIQLKKRIDYEKDPHQHLIRIRAVANDGLRSATATVTIKINDDNDNSPKFQKSEYTATVDEDAPPLTRVVNILATDADTASYGPIAYRIAGGLDSEHFELYKASPGVDVLVAKRAKLDFNNRDFYDLDIVALDNPSKTFSNVQQFSSVKLKIYIRDKNNHKPEFMEDESVRRMAVAETAPFGTSVGTIVATDEDFDANGDVFYYLQPSINTTKTEGLKLFTIVPRLGIVTVASSLIGYGGYVYNMQVFARDGGKPFLSNTLELQIEVLSTENDDGNPVWSNPAINNFEFTVIEEEPNSDVATLSALPRRGNRISYFLSDQSESAHSFKVDLTKGTLTVVKNLDREQKESYNLLVYAQDTENPEFRTGRQIIVRLTDKEDNDPTFTNPKGYAQCEAISSPLEFTINENIEKGVRVYTLQACDPDSNSEISYSFYNANDYCKKNNDKSGLTVEEDGHIITNQKIDYEVDKEFIMCIIAKDKTSTRKKRAFDFKEVDKTLDNVAYLLVHVRDQNDNNPIFPEKTITAVMHTDSRDYPIVVLNAKDIDGKGFNAIKYTIVDTKFYPSDSDKPTSPGRAFVIKDNELHPDPPRGFTFQQFARGRFMLTIKAEDEISPQNSDTQKITVYVHEKGQAMKIILDLQPSRGFIVGKDVVKTLNAVSNSHTFYYLHVSAHNSKGDGIDISKTDVCFIAVDAVNHTILNINELLDVLVRPQYQKVLEQLNYKALDRGKCYPSVSSEEQLKWRDLWWVLVVVGIFIAVCSIFFIVIIFFMYRRYKRYMETEKTYLVPQ